MRKLVFVVILGFFSGCASMEKKFANVQPGQPMTSVMDSLGSPAQFRQESGTHVAVWGINEFTQCMIKFNEKELVTEKQCVVDEEERQRYNQRLQAYYQSIQENMQRDADRQTASKNAYLNQLNSQKQTNCTTRWIGSVAHTNCY